MFSTNVSWKLSREIVNSSKVKLRGKRRVTYCIHFRVVFRLFNFCSTFHAATHGRPFMCYFPHDFHPTLPRLQKERAAFQNAQISKIFTRFFGGVLAPLDPAQHFLNAVLRIRDI